MGTLLNSATELVDRLTGTPVEILNKQLEEKKKNLFRLISEKDVLEKDLAGFSCPGYDHFKSEVLFRERTRLLELRMTIDAKETDLHRELQGQFNEIELLSKSKDLIAHEISVHEHSIEVVNDKIGKLLTTINRATRSNQKK